MKFIVNTATHQGTRPYQEDTLLVDENYEGGILALVADGLGGYPDGDFASKELSLIIQDNFRLHLQSCGNTETALQKCVASANVIFIQRIKDENKDRRSSTTLVVVYIKDGIVFAASVGDSLLSLVDLKTKTELQKNVLHESPGGGLTSAFGFYYFAGTWFNKFEIKPDQTLVLATDGIEFLLRHDPLSFAEQISDTGPYTLAKDLVDKTISINHRSQDNVTVISISCLT